jgi:hypothetical protein
MFSIHSVGRGLQQKITIYKIILRLTSSMYENVSAILTDSRLLKLVTRVHDSLPLCDILSKMDWVHTLTPSQTLLSCPRSPKLSLYFSYLDLSTKCYMYSHIFHASSIMHDKRFNETQLKQVRLYVNVWGISEVLWSLQTISWPVAWRPSNLLGPNTSLP